MVMATPITSTKLSIRYTSHSISIEDVAKLSINNSELFSPQLASHKPLVTLGFCMKNCEKQIEDAINSILDQDFPHDMLEAIFVDDGSKDCTLSIVNKWLTKTDIKMRVFSYGWRGLGQARNTIFHNAAGDFLVWIDCDEIFPKRYVHDLVDFMNKHPQVGIAIGFPWILPSWSLVLSLEILANYVEYIQASRPRNLLWKTTRLPGTGGAIVRMDAMRQIKGFDDKITGVGEDQEVVLRMIAIGWQIGWVNSHYYETYGGMATPRQLWEKYFWRGQGSQIIYLKNKSMFSLVRISPIGSMIAGVMYAIESYKYTCLKKSFLIPLHFFFKKMAWFAGFVQGQIQRHTI